MKATYKRNVRKYDSLVTYNGVVDTGYYKETLLIDRISKEDAINDATNEIELLESMSKYPNSQF